MIKTYRDGSKEYWVDGKLHREDGPAIMWWDGRQYWFLDDLEYTFYQFQYAKKYKFLRYIQRAKFYIINKFYKG